MTCRRQVLLRTSSLSVEAHVTPDIVSRPPAWPEGIRGRRRALLNSANQGLVGTKLPYFPMDPNAAATSNSGAAPPPPGLATSKWGGLEAGPGMFYPVQVIDGVVAQYGGRQLREQLAAVPVLDGTSKQEAVKVPTGSALALPAVGDLRNSYDVIVHAVAPLYPNRPSAGDGDGGGAGGSGGHDDSDDARGFEKLLEQAWISALNAATTFDSGCGVLVCPLLTAGAKKAPPEVAASVAARALAGWRGPDAADGPPLLVQFVCRPDDDSSSRTNGGSRVFNIVTDALLGVKGS